MEENRTQLGTITYYILTAIMGLFAINCLLAIVEISSTIAKSKTPFGVILLSLIVLLAIIAVVFFVYYKYWNAFRFNTPGNIKGVTGFMLVISAIGLLFTVPAVLFLMSHGLKKSEYSNALIMMTLWLICFIILKIELKAYENGKINSTVANLWIVVAVIALLSFLSNFISGSENITKLRGIIGILINICFDIGITLIAYWVTNQDKFYIPQPPEEYLWTVESGAEVTERPQTTDNYSSQLRELKELLDDGIITQEDYETKKKEILGL